MGDIVKTVRKGRFIGWYVRYKDTDGRRKTRASHQPTRELARRYLVEIEARVARGRIGIPEPTPPAPSVAELCERFLREYSRPKIKDLPRYRAYARTALRRALPQLGALPADQVQAAELVRLRDMLSHKCSANSVRLTFSFLSVVFTWAVRQQLLPKSPLHGVELPSRRDCVEFLSRSEAEKLLGHAREHAPAVYPMILTALYTGLRKGELLGLRWQDVDLAARRLTVSRSYRRSPKGGKPRHLRLPEAIAPVLSQWSASCPPTADGLVFPVCTRGGARMGSEQSMQGLPELLRAAGCRPLPRAWHALRHSFASHYIMSGGNILALQKILGHSDIKMTMIYAHLAPDFLGEEMNRLKF